MGQYRKRPVVIDAVQIKGVEGHALRLDELPPEWLIEARDRPSARLGAVKIVDGYVWVRSPSGVISGGPGDWICRQDESDIYIIKEETFAGLYEAIE